jgi:radical SAM superfamily enzyme YgiQ (UPF0313 family)
MAHESLDMLLVNPGTELAERGSWNREPPLGLLYIAAVLDRDGYSCQIAELSVDERQIEEILQDIPVPHVLGFTCLTNTASRAMLLASKAKTFYEHDRGARPIIVMGGPHATFTFEQTLATGTIDFCFLGEVEPSISAFVQIALAKDDVDSIKDVIVADGGASFNIAFKDNQENLVIFRDAPLYCQDIDQIPYPARFLYPINQPNHVYNIATVLVNRGCPNQCIFCSRQALFREARWRSVANVMQELRDIHAAGTYDYYNMYDNLTVSRPFMRELLRAMVNDPALSLPWGAELRADMITENDARLLEQANCQCAATGIESADEGILKTAGKFQTPEKVMAGLHVLKAEGIPVQAYFVVGLPGETYKTFEATLRFIESSPLQPGIDKIDFFAATPYPGSQLYESRERYGIQIRDPDFDHYDCQHLICELPTLVWGDLESIWAEAKQFEARFNRA